MIKLNLNLIKSFFIKIQLNIKTALTILYFYNIWFFKVGYFYYFSGHIQKLLFMKNLITNNQFLLRSMSFFLKMANLQLHRIELYLWTLLLNKSTTAIYQKFCINWLPGHLLDTWQLLKNELFTLIVINEAFYSISLK